VGLFAAASAVVRETTADERGKVRMMNEETSSPKISSAAAAASSSDQPGAVERELSDLRKEVIEARNLVIKSDNLLKNLHAELKLTSRKQEQFERRHLVTSATAFIIFAALAGVGAYSYARSEIHAVRQEASANEGQAKTRGQEIEKLRAADAARRDASEKAQRIFEQLQKGTEGPELSAAMVAATRLDKSLLSALEAKALEDKEASLKVTVAQAAHDRGKAAFRRSDFRTAATEFARFVELMPNSPDAPFAQFWLGESRSQLRDYQGAVPALEAFLKTSTTPKNHDWASVLLGVALEETGQWAKAQEVYTSAINKFPGSIHVTQMKNRLKRIPSAMAAAETKKTTAAIPPKP
jgi:TolA-binding protein